MISVGSSLGGLHGHRDACLLEPSDVFDVLVPGDVRSPTLIHAGRRPDTSDRRASPAYSGIVSPPGSAFKVAGPGEVVGAIRPAQMLPASDVGPHCGAVVEHRAGKQLKQV